MLAQHATRRAALPDLFPAAGAVAVRRGPGSCFRADLAGEMASSTGRLRQGSPRPVNEFTTTAAAAWRERGRADAADVCYRAGARAARAWARGGEVHAPRTGQQPSGPGGPRPGVSAKESHGIAACVGPAVLAVIKNY
jgi:hypothetical protein